MRFTGLLKRTALCEDITFSGGIVFHLHGRVNLEIEYLLDTKKHSIVVECASVSRYQSNRMVRHEWPYLFWPYFAETGIDSSYV